MIKLCASVNLFTSSNSDFLLLLERGIETNSGNSSSTRAIVSIQSRIYRLFIVIVHACLRRKEIKTI